MSSKARKAAEAMVKRTRSSTLTSNNPYGVTDEQAQDMREVFGMFTEGGLRQLNARRMLLAMRALGFNPSQSEVQETIEHYYYTQSKGKAIKVRTDSSGSNSKKSGGKQGQLRRQEVTDSSPAEGTSRPPRRSSRKSAQIARRGGPGSRSAYVDDSDDDVRSLSDNDDGAAELDSDDSDAYHQNSDDEEDEVMSDDQEASDEDIVYSDPDDRVRIREDDFMRMVAPQMRVLYDEMEIDRVFQLFDTEGKGAIGVEDLKRVSKELGIPMKDQELSEMVEEADKDGDQRINRGEFARIMRRIGLLS